MKRNVLFAVLFSLLVPGLGQIYNEDFTKGLLFIVGTFLGLIFFGPAYLVFVLWATIDAFVRARGISHGPNEA